MKMRQIRLSLQYDGTDYAGWQSQSDRETVQSLLEKAVRMVTGDSSRVTGSSRTDAGVHALGQVATFSTDSALDTDVMRRALNANLPLDIRIMDVSTCPDGFHPRYSAISKSYVYFITDTRFQSVFLRRYAWHIPHDLSSRLEMMKEAAGFLKGEHDFSSFRGAGCGSKSPVRRVIDIGVSRLTSICFMTFSMNVPVIQIRIRGNAFLRHMVRNIVGTLVEFGVGRRMPKEMQDLIELKDRNRAGRTAPAHGLFLEKVYY
jgi:tRNA pseudouridine38-40 synthase